MHPLKNVFRRREGRDYLRGAAAKNILTPLALAIAMLLGAEYVTRRAAVPGAIRWGTIFILWLACVAFLVEFMGTM